MPNVAHLPTPLLDLEDPAAQAVGGAQAIAEPARRVAALRFACGQFPRSREARLRLAAALADCKEFAEAEDLLTALGNEDAWDWRVLWFEGRMRLMQADPGAARKLFDQVYFDLPGEIAPKLALALAAELAGDLAVARQMYDLVSRTDPGFVSSVFGLARCHARERDRRAAVAALERILPSSSLFVRSRVEAARTLVQTDAKLAAPTLEDLVAASALAESLTLDGLEKCTLASQILASAIALAATGKRPANGAKILGQPVEERALRFGLESAYRAMARLTNGEERIELIDRANFARPRTLI